MQMSTLNVLSLNNTRRAQNQIVIFNRVPKVGSQTFMELLRRLALRNNFKFHRDSVQRVETIRLAPHQQEELAEMVSELPTPSGKEKLNSSWHIQSKAMKACQQETFALWNIQASFRSIQHTKEGLEKMRKMNSAWRCDYTETSHPSSQYKSSLSHLHSFECSHIWIFAFAFQSMWSMFATPTSRNTTCRHQFTWIWCGIPLRE